MRCLWKVLFSSFIGERQREQRIFSPYSEVASTTRSFSMRSIRALW